jgi:hypothetical protein
MPVSPLLTTLTHKFPPKGVYGAREKLVKPGLSLYEPERALFTEINSPG